MSTLKQRLLYNWHAVRVMRLGIGIMLLVAAIQTKDFKTLFLLAHTMKGLCASLGAEQLSSQFAVIENASASKSADKISQLVDLIEISMEKLIKEIDFFIPAEPPQ